MDELAHAAGAYRVAFRLKHLNDQRLIDVINASAKLAKWQPRPAASKIGSGRYLTGRGIAAMVYEGDNGYNSAVFQVTVDTKTGKIVVDHCWSAQDCCPVLKPRAMKLQAEGCLMQTISRTLLEDVKWGPNGDHVEGLEDVPGDPLQRDAPVSTSRSSTARTRSRWAPARC